MNPGAKYNEFTLLFDWVVVDENTILCLHTSSWSLELILCGFEVHMSTTTSPTESFKLLLEMIQGAHLCFDENVYLFGLFIWITTTQSDWFRTGENQPQSACGSPRWNSILTCGLLPHLAVCMKSLRLNFRVRGRLGSVSKMERLPYRFQLENVMKPSICGSTILSPIIYYRIILNIDLWWTLGRCLYSNDR